MREFDLKINDLITFSNELLSRDMIALNEIERYKKDCAKVYIELINEGIDSTISELATRGLKFRITKINNPFLRWFYYLLTAARDDITFNAPYLKGSTDTDYAKQYIFWTKFMLEGILSNLQTTFPH